MTTLWNGLRDFPGTPAKIFAGIVCELLYVIVILTGLVLGKPMPLDIVIALGSVVLAFNGVTTWQYQIGRNTDRELNAIRAQGPSPVNVEAPAQVNVTQEQPAARPTVEVQPLVSRPAPQVRVPVPLTHRESEKD